MASQSVDAASGAPHVAEHQLQYGRGADDLCSESVLRPAHGVDDRGDLFHVAVFPNGREELSRLQELLPRDAGDALDHFRRVARVLLLEELENTARMLEREVVSDIWGQGGRGRTWSRMLRPSGRVGYRHLARQVAALLIVPGGLVVRPRRRIKARGQTVLREFEALLNHEGRVGVMSEVFFGDPIVLNGVVDQAAEEG